MGWPRVVEGLAAQMDSGHEGSVNSIVVVDQYLKIYLPFVIDIGRCKYLQARAVGGEVNGGEEVVYGLTYSVVQATLAGNVSPLPHSLFQIHTGNLNYMLMQVEIFIRGQLNFNWTFKME